MPTLSVKHSGEIKRLFQESFSGMELYYGRDLDDEFMHRRLFSSVLYSTDCSRIQYAGDRGITAAAFANWRKRPDQSSADSLYLNLFFMKPDASGTCSAKQLIVDLMKLAKNAGKKSMVTSLQWTGVWPGILSHHTQAIEICRTTGAQLSQGEVFLESDICRTLKLAGRKLKPLALDLEIRRYRVDDYENLHHFMSQNFSVGWLHETMSKVSAAFESFNGYGLANSYRPDDVFVIADTQRIYGFCVVQSVTGDDRSFIGPIGMAPSLRGQGIGPHLFLKALEYLRSRNKKSVGLWTTESIYQGFYSRFDMKKTMSTQCAEWKL